MDDPAWKDDMGRLANGFISRQQNGAWHTTTANLWGGLALGKVLLPSLKPCPLLAAPRPAMSAGTAGGGLEQGGTHQDHRCIRCCTPDHMLRRACIARQPAQQQHVPALEQNAAKDTLSVTHQGSGKPWLTLQSVAAVQLKAPFNAGYQIKKTITPVEQANKSLPPGSYTRGDVLRITPGSKRRAPT